MKSLIIYKNKFIYRIPLYIIIYEIWAVISNHYHINTGINGFFSAMMMVYVVYYFNNFSEKVKRINCSILILTLLFLCYLFFRIDFLCDIESMVTRYLSYVNLFAFMIISYCETCKYKDLVLLIKTLLQLLFLYILTTIVFSVFRIGESMYGVGIIYGFAHMQPNSISVVTAGLFCILTSLKKSYFNDNKKYYYLLFFIVLILCFTFRRTYLMLIIAVVIPFFIFRFKMKYLWMMVSCFVFFILFYFFVGIKRDRFSTMDTKEEGRFIEYALVNGMFEKDMNLMLFGNGTMFITRGKYEMNNRENRPLHTGHTELLLGAGYVGLILFISIFISYFSIFLFSGIKSNRRVDYSMLFSFLIVYIILSFSGGIRSPSSIVIIIFYSAINKYLIYAKRTNSCNISRL